MSADTLLSRRIIVMLSGERDSRSEARSESKHPYTNLSAAEWTSFVSGPRLAGRQSE
jgi:hypothetical protein